MLDNQSLVSRWNFSPVDRGFLFSDQNQLRATAAVLYLAALFVAKEGAVLEKFL